MKENAKAKRDARIRRKRRVRKKLSGTAECPRLSVFRGHRHIFAQLVDDDTGTTLAAASSIKLKAPKPEKGEGSKCATARSVGVELAKKASDKGVTSVVFDRGGFKFHGRVAALARGAREGGLKF
jgi:large subunit ribosomal protein L18